MDYLAASAGGTFKAPGPNVSGCLFEKLKISQNELLLVVLLAGAGIGVPGGKLLLGLGTNNSGFCSGVVTGGLFVPVMTSQNERFCFA